MYMDDIKPFVKKGKRIRNPNTDSENMQLGHMGWNSAEKNAPCSEWEVGKDNWRKE